MLIKIKKNILAIFNKRIHDAIQEATGEDLSFDKCIMFLENNQDILQLILSIGECETEVGDQCFEKAKKNLKKFGNLYGIESKFS